MPIIVRKRTVFIFLTLVGLLAYVNSFSVPFHYDDIHFLKEQIVIKTFPAFLSWITNNFISAIITGRAFLLFTFYLNYLVNGLDTFGYHLVNLFIHTGTAFLFYLLLSRYVDRGKDEPYHLTAIFASTLFLLLPINTESVTYLSSRSSSLSTLLILATMLAFFKATGREFRMSGYLLSLFFFVLALSTKQTAAVAPALMLLFDVYFVSRDSTDFKARLKYHLPFWGIMLAGSFVYAHTIMHPEMYDRPWLTHILTELKVFVEYIRLSFLPFGLTIDHDIRESVSLDLPAVVSIAIISILLAAALFLRNRNRIISFSIFWFFLNLSPLLILRLSDYMADRWAYAASLGFSLALSERLVALFDKHRKTGVAVALCIVVFFGSYVHIRNNIFSDPIALWAEAVSKSPNKIRPYTNLGVAYMERGEVDKAIDVMELSISKGNSVVEMYLNLAMAYYLKDDLSEAENILLSLEGQVASHHYYYNLGVVYKGMKKYQKAIAMFKKAAEGRAASPAVFGSIGECYKNLGRNEEAKTYYRMATRGIPQSPEDFIMIANAYFDLGDGDMGRSSLVGALRADPLNIYNRNVVAMTYLEKKNYDEAYKHFAAMAKISPNLPMAYKGMGRALLGKNRIPEAKKYFTKALGLLPAGSPDRKELLDLLARI